MYNTSLNSRTLWFDGDSSFDPLLLSKFVRLCDVKYVDRIDDTVRLYNRNVPKDRELSVKTACEPLNFDWNIPKEYKTLDVVQYVSEQHLPIANGIDPDECSLREVRLAQELSLYKKKNLFGVLRTVIYIINNLTSSNVVWGVGRGSSVSSYVLYVIGVHDIDSYMYDLDIKDFISE